VPEWALPITLSHDPISRRLLSRYARKLSAAAVKGIPWIGQGIWAILHPNDPSTEELQDEINRLSGTVGDIAIASAQSATLIAANSASIAENADDIAAVAALVEANAALIEDLQNEVDAGFLAVQRSFDDLSGELNLRFATISSQFNILEHAYNHLQDDVLSARQYALRLTHLSRHLTHTASLLTPSSLKFFRLMALSSIEHVHDPSVPEISMITDREPFYVFRITNELVHSFDTVSPFTPWCGLKRVVCKGYMEKVWTPNHFLGAHEAYMVRETVERCYEIDLIDSPDPVLGLSAGYELCPGGVIADPADQAALHAEVYSSYFPPGELIVGSASYEAPRFVYECIEGGFRPEGKAGLWCEDATGSNRAIADACYALNPGVVDVAVAKCLVGGAFTLYTGLACGAGTRDRGEVCGFNDGVNDVKLHSECTPLRDGSAGACGPIAIDGVYRCDDRVGLHHCPGPDCGVYSDIIGDGVSFYSFEPPFVPLQTVGSRNAASQFWATATHNTDDEWVAKTRFFDPIEVYLSNFPVVTEPNVTDKVLELFHASDGKDALGLLSYGDFIELPVGREVVTGRTIVADENLVRYSEQILDFDKGIFSGAWEPQAGCTLVDRGLASDLCCDREYNWLSGTTLVPEVVGLDVRVTDVEVRRLWDTVNFRLEQIEAIAGPQLNLTVTSIIERAQIVQNISRDLQLASGLVADHALLHETAAKQLATTFAELARQADDVQMNVKTIKRNSVLVVAIAVALGSVAGLGLVWYFCLRQPKMRMGL
jgi:hypothetical protein